MTAVVILPHGTQVPITVDDVARYLSDVVEIERTESNGSQAAYRLTFPEENISFTVVANWHSEANEMLAQASRS